MNARHGSFRGFANVVDPRPEEIRMWAYQPDSIPIGSMPDQWDLLVANDRLIGTWFELASDARCPARRFALHCMYIFAADSIRTGFRAHPKRRLFRFFESAGAGGDEVMRIWVHNSRALLADPMIFAYSDWCGGGLVRNPRRL